MGKNKKNDKVQRKKPYKSLPSNIIWCFGRQLRYAPSGFFMYMIQTPVNVGLQYGAVYLPSLVVAEVTGNKGFSHAARAVGLLMLAMLLGGILQKLFFFLIANGHQQCRRAITEELYRKALGLFYQRYENKDMRDLFDRAARATQEWNNRLPIRDLQKRAWDMAESVLCYVLFGAVISFVSPWLVLLLTVTPLLEHFSIRAYQKWHYSVREKRSDIQSRLNYLNYKPADFRIAKDVRVYGMVGWLTECYQSLLAEHFNLQRKQTLRAFLSRMPGLLIILLRDGAAYAVLIAMTLKGEITPDEFVLYFAAISSFADWVGRLVDHWGDLHSLSLQICDLREYLEYPEQDGSGKASLGDIAALPEIRFEHVSFRYEGSREDTIKDVSFTLRPGEKLALVGLNGAGKTTLVKLLCGLYLPTGGDILIDGHSIRDFKRDDYYRLFSPVFQDIRTLYYSLAETVSCRTLAETDLALTEKCMREAGLGEKIDSLPQGIRTKLDKQVNKDGTELSGGELQKLFLARALYKDARILVLDEPTAALDPISENEIYLKYKEMTADKSSLFISHRLASTRFCDRILYLEGGRIAEEGTHSELLAAGGKYAALFEIQSCWYRENPEPETAYEA